MSLRNFKSRFVPLEIDKDDNVRTLERCAIRDGLDLEKMSYMDMFTGKTCPFSGVLIRSEIPNFRELSADNPRKAVEELMRSSIIHETWQHLRWRNSGRIILDIDSALAFSFLDTNVTLSGADLNIALNSFYLTVDDLGLKFTKNGINKVLGFYISRTELMQDRAYDCILVQVISKNETISLDIPLVEEITDIEKYIKDRAHKLESNGELWTMCARLVVNTLLYLSTDDADVVREPFVPGWVREEAAKRSHKQGERLIRQHTNDTILYSTIGKKLGATIDRRICERGSLNDDRHRFIVRGHWRKQPHGPELELRKNIWIKPFWKGPEWSEVIATRVQRVEGGAL